jgi:hypothetical protein
MSGYRFPVCFVLLLVASIAHADPLAPSDDPSPARAHDRTGWRDIARRHTVDRLPSQISPAGESPVAAVPPPGAGDAGRRARRRTPAVLSSAAVASSSTRIARRARLVMRRVCAVSIADAGEAWRGPRRSATSPQRQVLPNDRTPRLTGVAPAPGQLRTPRPPFGGGGNCCNIHRELLKGYAEVP